MTFKNFTLALAIYVIGFMVVRECQLIHHYVVINRDFVPVMSYFYQTGAMYFLDCAATLMTIFVGYQARNGAVKLLAA